MKSNKNQKFAISRVGNQWSINDPDSNYPGIKVDAVIVNATFRRHDYVEGYIVSVQGLDQAVAEALDRQTLAALGVGAQLRMTLRSFNNSSPRLHLGLDGQISRGQR